MRRCIIAGKDECDGRIEWHHAFSYGGKRVDEIWSLLPACTKHHREEAQWRDRIHFWLKQRINHFGAWIEVGLKYPKAVWR